MLGQLLGSSGGHGGIGGIGGRKKGHVFAPTHPFYGGVPVATAYGLQNTLKKKGIKQKDVAKVLGAVLLYKALRPRRRRWKPHFPGGYFGSSYYYGGPRYYYGSNGRYYGSNGRHYGSNGRYNATTFINETALTNETLKEILANGIYIEECRYKKEPWEDCDPVSNTQKRKLLLKRGSGKCEPTKELTRNCKKACRYEKGVWNACNVTANTRTRVDKLKPRSDATCEPNRTVTKKCKSGLGCRYNRSVKWSECDTQTQTRTKTMPLVSGNSAGCESHKVVTKPCRSPAGGDQRQNKRRPKQDEAEEEEDE